MKSSKKTIFEDAHKKSGKKSMTVCGVFALSFIGSVQWLEASISVVGSSLGVFGLNLVDV
jgi:hypothetical protein